METSMATWNEKTVKERLDTTQALLAPMLRQCLWVIGREHLDRVVETVGPLADTVLSIANPGHEEETTVWVAAALHIAVALHGNDMYESVPHPFRHSQRDRIPRANVMLAVASILQDVCRGVIRLEYAHSPPLDE